MRSGSSTSAAATTQCLGPFKSRAGDLWTPTHSHIATHRIVTWMRVHELLVPGTYAEVWRVSRLLRPYAVDAPTTPVCQRLYEEWQAAFGGSDCADALVDAVERFTLDWAEAQHAEAAAVTRSFPDQLRKVIDATARQTSLYTCRSPKQRPDLLYLRAPHFDECLFDPDKTLAAGGNGTLHVGVTLRGVPLAVKACRYKPDIPGQHLRVRQGLDREGKHISAASSYGVLHTMHTQRQSYLVMPLFAGTLKTYERSLLSPPGATSATDVHGRSSLPAARYVLAELLTALCAIHDRAKVVHQDIKPSNIFVDGAMRRLVLGDFGEASDIEADGHCLRHGLSERFAAPEQLESTRLVGSKADLFCLGTTMYDVLLAGCEPVMAHRRAHFPDHRHPTLFWRSAAHSRIPADRPRHSCEKPLLAGSFDDGGLPAAWPMEQRRFHAVFASRVDGQHSGHPASMDSLLLAEMRCQPQHQHFLSIHQSVAALDGSLDALLRSLLHFDPRNRPSASQALARLAAFDDGVSARFDATACWQTIPHIDPEHEREAERMRTFVQTQNTPASQQRA